jgi:hypothetical protein
MVYSRVRTSSCMCSAALSSSYYQNLKGHNLCSETSFADPHHFDADADPDPSFDCDSDPDPDATFHSEADPYPDPTSNFFYPPILQHDPL